MDGRSPTLVGRVAERRTLAAASAGVAAGGVAAVLVGGEAGIGKSRLAGTHLDELRAAGWTRLDGGCVEADGLPFAPFVAALRGLATELDDTDRGRLAPLLPGLAVPAAAGSAAEQTRPQLFEGVLALLARLAADRPLALLLEDAHWADRSSLDLVEFLVRNQRAAPGSMIVLTHRSDEPGARGLRPLLAGLGRLPWVHRLVLGPLSRAEVSAQAAGILGRPADPALVAGVYRRSDGNPLFVEALLDGAPGVPASLADLLSARVDGLGPDTAAALRALAVGGLRVPHRVADAIRPGIDRSLRPAVEAHVLVVDGDAYRFRHALIRDAVLADVLPGERADLHRRYAAALHATGGTAAELAHHLTGAGDGPGAVAAAWAAAGQARRALAYAEELDQLERLLAWWDRVAGTEQAVGESRAAVLERAATAALRAGEPVRAEELAGLALAEPAGHGVRTAALLELRAQARARSGRPGAIDDLRAGLVAAHPHAAIRPYLLNALAAQLMEVPDPDGARAAAEQALAEVGGTGDDPAEAAALITLATLEARTGDLDAQLPRLTRAADIARRMGAHRIGLRAVDQRAHLLLGYGRLAEAERAARDGLAWAAEAGLTRFAGAVHGVNLAATLVAAGRWDDAEESIGHALDLVPPARDQSALLALRAGIALHRGRLDDADHLLADAERLAGESPVPPLELPRLRIRLLLARGAAGEAAELAAATLAGLRPGDRARYAWPLLVAAAAAHRATATTGPATARATGAARPTGATTAGSASGVDGTADRSGGTVLRDLAGALPACTDPQRAAAATVAALLNPTPDTWTAAVAAWERSPHPFELAEAAHGLGAALLAAGEDRERAAVALRRAAELAGSLNAAPLLAEVLDLARRARLPIRDGPAGTTADLPARLGLTPRETEVLRLVAAGLANADIADRLFISAKTASVHVSNILGKLEVANRVEAAALAHRLGLA